MPANHSCQRCPLHRGVQTVCVWGDDGGNPATGKIMLIGEAPGADEDKEGRPFVGAAGRVLDRALAEAGLSRADVYIANVAKCRPPSNRTPTEPEANACLPYLLEEIETTKPRAMMVMGNTALELLTGNKFVGKARGRVLKPRKGYRIDVPIMATYHPAASLHNPAGGMYPALVEDLRRVSQREKPQGNLLRLPPASFGRAPDEPADRAAALASLAAAPYLTCDLEWSAGADGTMMYPWQPRAEMYSLSLSGRIDGQICTVALGLPQAPEVAATMRQLLRERPIIFQNAMADAVWLAWYKVEVRLAGDTMLLMQQLDENESRSLESIAISYGGADPAWKMKSRTIRSSQPASIEEWVSLLDYNAKDTANTLLAFEGLIAACKEEGPERAQAIFRLHEKLLMPALKPLIEMVVEGMPIDRALLRKELAASKARWDATALEISKITGLSPLAASKMATSTDQTQAYLKAAYNVDIEGSSKEEMSKISQLPIVPLIWDVRGEQKNSNTYLGPWERTLERSHTDRLRSIYKPTGARTGRLSAELEQQPKGMPKGAPINVAPKDTPKLKFRSIAACRADGPTQILSCDFSQMELRLMSWIAGEKTMLAVYKENVKADLHTFLAAFIMAQTDHPGISAQQFMAYHRQEYEAKVGKKSAERDAAKGANFGLGYGMQPLHFQNYARTQYGVILTLEQATFLRRSYMQLYSDLEPWHAREMAWARHYGYKDTIFGRRRHFLDPNDLLPAINFPVQSTGTDICMLAMGQANVILKQEGLRTKFIGEIHDSIMQEVHEDDLDRVKAITIHCMENVDTSAFGFKIPIALPADASVGKSWGEAA